MRINIPEFRAGDIGRYGKTALLALFYVAVLFCLADGIVDVVLSQAGRINDRFHKTAGKLQDPDALIAGVVPARNYYLFADLKAADYQAAVGPIPLPLSRPGLHVGAYGERGTPPVPSPSATGLLLGASQAFGQYDLDDETLAASLQRALPGVAIRNFAVTGQRVQQSMVWWRALRDRGIRSDFVVLASGPTDLAECRKVPNPQPVRQGGLALARLFRGAPKERGPRPGAPSCRTPREIALHVDRLIYDFESALAYARSVGVPLVIVVPPTPYGNNSDHSNLKSAQQFMNPLTWALRRRLKDHPIAGVYDLSDAFDGKPRYFIDMGGHMSATGQQVLAQAIVRRVGADFFRPRDQKSK